MVRLNRTPLIERLYAQNDCSPLPKLTICESYADEEDPDSEISNFNGPEVKMSAEPTKRDLVACMVKSKYPTIPRARTETTITLYGYIMSEHLLNVSVSLQVTVIERS
jgi:hypothetical protein